MLEVADEGAVRAIDSGEQLKAMRRGVALWQALQDRIAVARCVVVVGLNSLKPRQCIKACPVARIVSSRLRCQLLVRLDQDAE